MAKSNLSKSNMSCTDLKQRVTKLLLMVCRKCVQCPPWLRSQSKLRSHVKSPVTSDICRSSLEAGVCAVKARKHNCAGLLRAERFQNSRDHTHNLTSNSWVHHVAGLENYLLIVTPTQNSTQQTRSSTVYVRRLYGGMQCWELADLSTPALCGLAWGYVWEYSSWTLS